MRVVKKSLGYLRQFLAETGAFSAVKEGMGMDVIKDVEVVKTCAGALSFVFFVAFAPLIDLADAWK